MSVPSSSVFHSHHYQSFPEVDNKLSVESLSDLIRAYRI